MTDKGWTILDYTPTAYRDMPGDPAWGIPRFFKRIWDAREIPAVQTIEQGVMVTPTAGMRLVIYGYALVTDDPHDIRVREQQWRTRRRFESVNFSTLVRDRGELGFVGLSDIEVISEDEFLAAYARGWVE